MISTALTSAVETGGRTNHSALEGYISAVAAGDKKALESLYEQTKASVYGYVLSILKSEPDAEDVLQSTYIKIFEAAAQYERRGKPMAWILTVAKSLALMKLRERTRTTELPDWDSLKFSSDSPESQLEDRLLLSGAVSALSDEELQIVMLHCVSGLKHREIAAFLDIPLATILSKYHRSIKKLKIILEEGKRDEQQ